MHTRFSAGSIGIRRFQTGDVNHLFNAAQESLEELCQWMLWCGRDYSLEAAESFIARCDDDWRAGRSYSFVIFDEQNDEFLGSVGLSQISRVHCFANLGYWVRTGRTRRGVATTAVRLAAQFAFQRLSLHRLELLVPSTNAASRRVAEKVGAICEGLLHRRLVLAGISLDAFLYALTDDRFLNAQSVNQARVGELTTAR